MDRTIPFPQADDFEKIIEILNIPKEDELLDSLFLKHYLIGINTDRQASYYISACEYLGLVNKDKKFTELGKAIRNLKINEQIEKLKEIVLDDNIFGKAYKKYLNSNELQINEIIELIKKTYPSYSEAVYKRRAQTVKNWIKWICK